jgi:hypothetical protein
MPGPRVLTRSGVRAAATSTSASFRWVLNRARGLSAWAHRHRGLAVGGGLVVLWIVVGGGLALWFSGRIRDWSVMSDELLYAKLATAIAETRSPLPEIHETSISVYNQLYPLLLAPLYGTLQPPNAFRAAHVLNAFVMASALFPAYLLGREVLSRGWSFAMASLSVVVPWMVLTGFVMTESAAYPAFLWAVLGLQRAIARPSPRGDLLAVAALALALLARTQFVVLVVVLPLAILGHEIGRVLLSPSSAPAWRKALEGAAEAARRHRLLAVLYAVGGVTAVVVAVAGSVGGVLGVYSVTVEGSVLPSGVWSAAARHIDAVAIGCGLAPLILGGGWMLAAVVRPRSEREHALATLSLLTVVLLTFEAASFGVRFGSSAVRDRYVFYVVPLLLIGTAAALTRASRRQVAIGAALVTIFFAATVWLLPFTTFASVWVDSPAGVLNEVLIEQSGSLGTGTFVALMGLLVGVVLVLGVLLVPRAPMALLVFAALLTFSILTLRSEVDRVRSSTSLAGRPIAGPPGLVLDWVDSVLPADATAAIVPFPVSTAWNTSAIRWWDVEFWNRSVTQAFAAPDGNFGYTPFSRRTLAIDWSTGEVPGTSDAPPFVVVAPRDSRFLLAGDRLADNLGFVIRSVDRPYSAVWMSRGLDIDGWTRPGRPATIRVYGGAGGQPELLLARITVRSPATAPARYRVSVPGATRSGSLGVDEEKPILVPVCVSGGSYVDVALSGTSSARIAEVQLSPDVVETRRVGVVVGPISVRRTGQTCQPQSLGVTLVSP